MLKQQMDAQGKAVDTIVGNMRVLEGKLGEAKMKKDTLKARAQSAKSARYINDVVRLLAFLLPCLGWVSGGCLGWGLVLLGAVRLQPPVPTHLHANPCCSACPACLPLPAPLQVAGLDTSSALGAFEKMEEKVMALEAQAEAAQMVSERGSKGGSAGRCKV